MLIFTIALVFTSLFLSGFFLNFLILAPFCKAQIGEHKEAAKVIHH